MITDLELVQLAAITYDRSAQPYYQPTGFADRLFRFEREDGLVTFMIEGTYDLPGWVGDFLAVPTAPPPAAGHAYLGMLHADFYQAALRLAAPVEDASRRGPVALGGHSRGAGIAAVLAGLMAVEGNPVAKLGLFAPPRAGGAELARVLTTYQPWCAYRAGNDPVPMVPFTLPSAPYQQLPLTTIGHPCLIPTECHHVSQYVEGIKVMVDLQLQQRSTAPPADSPQR